MESTGTYVVGRDETVGRSIGSTQTYFINDQGLIPTSYKTKLCETQSVSIHNMVKSRVDSKSPYI